MSTKRTPTKSPAARREVELAKPIVQDGRRFEPGGKDKPKLTARQIERMTASGHIANGAGGKAPAASQEG